MSAAIEQPALTCYPAVACGVLSAQVPPVTVRAHVHTASRGSKRQQVSWASYASVVDMTEAPNDEEYNIDPIDATYTDNAADYASAGILTVGYVDTNACSGATIADARGNGENPYGSTPDCSALERDGTNYLTYETSGTPVMVHNNNVVQMLGNPASATLLQAAEKSLATKYATGFDWIEYDDVADPGERLDQGDLQCGGIGTLAGTTYSCGSVPQVLSTSSLGGYANFAANEASFVSALYAALPATDPQRGILVNSLNVYDSQKGASYTNMATSLVLQDGAAVAGRCEECFSSAYAPHNLQILGDVSQVANAPGKTLIDAEYTSDPGTRLSALAKLMLVYNPQTTYEEFDGCLSPSGTGVAQISVCAEAAFDFYPSQSYQISNGIYYRTGFCYNGGVLMGICVAAANLTTTTQTTNVSDLAAVAIDDKDDYVTCTQAHDCVTTGTFTLSTVSFAPGQGEILLLGAAGNFGNLVSASPPATIL